jgi:DNA polymerase III epsilon subunit-like protein
VCLILKLVVVIQTHVKWGIDGFDMPILNRYCQKFDRWDSKRQYGNLLNPIFTFDVMKHIWLYTRTNAELKNIKLTTVAEYMGIKPKEIEEHAHDALWDVLTTSKIAIKLLKLVNYLIDINEHTGKRRLEMKGCLV